MVKAFFLELAGVLYLFAPLLVAAALSGVVIRYNLGSIVAVIVQRFLPSR